MNLRFCFELLAFLQLLAFSQNSHVQLAKQRIRTEVRSALGPARHPPPPSPSSSHYYNRHQHHHHRLQQQQRQRQRHHRHDHHHYHQLPPPPQHHHKRWTGRRQLIDHHHGYQQQHYSPWSSWSPCGGEDCVKRRVRYCRLKRKCGHTKHVEERKCWRCQSTHQHDGDHHYPPPPPPHVEQSHAPSTIVINAAAAASSGPHIAQHEALLTTTAAPSKVEYHLPPPHDEPPVEIVHPFVPHHPHNDDDEYEHSGEEAGESDFFVLKSRRKVKRQRQRRRRRRPVQVVRDYGVIGSKEYLDDDEFSNDFDDDDDYVDFTPNADISGEVRPRQLRHKRQRVKLQQQRSLTGSFDENGGGVDGDIFQYEDFDFDPDAGSMEAYDQHDYDDTPRNASHQWQQLNKERATPDALIPRHRRVYSKWSRWTKCSPKCTTRRYKKCRVREQCGREVLREIAYCYTEGSFCQQWLQAQVQKTPAYDLRPVTATRRMAEDTSAISNNAIVGDYIMNSKGYRGPEYAPMKLKCGIPPSRSNKRNMYNMLKIIGGKASRKGDWPWQVAIFNRFKEAFCGGTLIAPQWVLTAAHCVRKVLYVRMGEHNLDYEDGTEVQLRVLKSYKHPNFDKKTVDSDVALLRLPKPVNTTTWIGFSCLPRPYQPLPKNVDCTVIGWGKRRNRDLAGTSVLHQAEVPIITMNSCRRVYHDYTITKNMFCAGHERGRIDTCAGDSGGPLLCRDTTKPNHPWTIFGITSFGDGCAKRNKFGIYAKVPNYVDWVWSVVNCNGNCKLHQRAGDQ